MLVTSYGIDCALSQILYYHHTNRIDFATISNKVINRYLTKHKPEILIGLRPSLEHIDEKSILIDNTKRGYDMFNDLPNFVYDTKVSKTNILARYLKVNSQLQKYANLADAIISGNYTDANVIFLDFYNAVGHDTFVIRFITDGNLLLNKNEQQLALRFRKFQDETADNFLTDFMVKSEGIAVCRANYNMKDAIENAMLSKYREDLFLIATWDYDNDNNLRISVCSKSDLAGKIADKMDGDNYFRNGVYKLPYEDDEDDPSSYIMEQILAVYNEVVEEQQQTVYREKQREIEEYRQDNNNSDILDLF